MKKILLMMVLLGGIFSGVKAQNASNMKWSDICSGKMGSNWYGSDEAKTIADNVISGQKTNGGWMKNIEWHKLTASELKACTPITHNASTNTNNNNFFFIKSFSKQGGRAIVSLVWCVLSL